VTLQHVDSSRSQSACVPASNARCRSFSHRGILNGSSACSACSSCCVISTTNPCCTMLLWWCHVSAPTLPSIQASCIGIEATTNTHRTLGPGRHLVVNSSHVGVVSLSTPRPTVTVLDLPPNQSQGSGCGLRAGPTSGPCRLQNPVHRHLPLALPARV
jgi:hypothetical protein